MLRFLSLNIHNLHLKAIHNHEELSPQPRSVEIPLAQYTQFTFESNSQQSTPYLAHAYVEIPLAQYTQFTFESNSQRIRYY